MPWNERLRALDRRHRHHFAALAAYLLLTIGFTWPLLPDLDTHVLGGARLDNYEYVWKMGFIADALRAGRDPFFAPDIYVPFGYPLAYGEITPIHTFGMAPLTWLFGPVVSYNLAALGSTVLSGWAVYLLARRWLLRDSEMPVRLAALAAFTAGAAFAFSAYRMQKLTGHMPLFDTHWLALALLWFDLWLDRGRLREGAVLGGMVALAALSSWYYAFLLGLALPVVALARAGNLVPHLRDPRRWLSAVLAVVVVLTLCLPFLVPYLQLDSRGATVVPLREAAFWAASFTDYLMPNPLHPLWGEAISRVMWPLPTPMMTEFVISIGWVTLLLALIGARRTHGPSWRSLKWMMIAAFVLSLGPYLTISRLPLDIPLPDLLLREIVPFADSVRSWGRFSVLVQLGACVLTAAGLASLLRTQSARRQVGYGVLALGLILFGAWQGPQPLSEMRPRPVDTWLAAQPDRDPIMEFPLAEALSGPAMWYTTVHGHPVTFGYGTYLPLLYRQRHPALTTFPGDGALDQLAAWGVRYVLVSQWALSYDYSFTMAQVDAQLRLRRLISRDGVVVYELLR